MLNLIGVVIAFAVIIFLIRKKFNFGISLIIGSIILGMFSLQEIQPVDIPKAMIEASFYSFKTNQITTYTIELAILLTVIYILAKLMQETQSINRLIDSLRIFFSKGGILAVIPALYGLMPVPGGALFSAPAIDEEGDKYNLSKLQKNFLNVWFRHIWFPIFPISSAMILICSDKFSNIEDIYQLVVVNIPAFIAAITIGIIYLKIFVKNKVVIEKEKVDLHGFLFLLPPVVPLVFYVVVSYYFEIDTVRAFLIGMIVSIVLLYFLLDLSPREYVDKIKKAITWKLALAIFGIMIFREMFSASGADQILAEIIGGLPFAPLFVIVLIPVLLGFLTGYNLGAVALSYPLVEPFFMSSSINIIGISSIIFTASLAGYLISPIHLCNVLSSEYLKTETTRMYKMYVPATLFILIVQTIFIVVFFQI